MFGAMKDALAKLPFVGGLFGGGGGGDGGEDSAAGPDAEPDYAEGADYQEPAAEPPSETTAMMEEMAMGVQHPGRVVPVPSVPAPVAVNEYSPLERMEYERLLAWRTMNDRGHGRGHDAFHRAS